MFSKLWGATSSVEVVPAVKQAHVHSEGISSCSVCGKTRCESGLCPVRAFQQCSVRDASTKDRQCEGLVCDYCANLDPTPCSTCTRTLPVCKAHAGHPPGAMPRCCPVRDIGTQPARCETCMRRWAPTYPRWIVNTPPWCNQCGATLCPHCVSKIPVLPVLTCAGSKCGHRKLDVCQRCRATPRRVACDKGHLFCGYTCSARQRCTVCRNWACAVCEDGQYVHKACMRFVPKRAVKKEATAAPESRKRKVNA